jgi:hypothetical protein
MTPAATAGPGLSSNHAWTWLAADDDATTGRCPAWAGGFVGESDTCGEPGLVGFTGGRCQPLPWFHRRRSVAPLSHPTSATRPPTRKTRPKPEAQKMEQLRAKECGGADR